MRFSTITFIGLGLIGGSIARAIHERFPSVEIKAHAGHKSTLEEAYEAGVIKNGDFLYIGDLASSDLIFLCSPVRVNSSYLKELKPYISKKTLLTDVGSVKSDIERSVRENGLSSQFIGGHPMAGTEKTGFMNSDPHLIENAYYILTAGADVPEDLKEDFSSFISSLGALPITMTPKAHDFATAAISHLPHLISASLVNLVRESDDGKGTLRTIAAGGFRDITRISSSSPVMWQNICLANRDEILKLLSLYEGKLGEFKAAVEARDEDRILSLFSSAKSYRDSLPAKDTGILPKTYEFSMEVSDRPGQIAEISSILANQSISIRDIGIVHNREQGEGQLRIEFYDEEARARALKVLTHHNYILHVN